MNSINKEKERVLICVFRWRSFENERKIAESKGFIDGDLVESFLELPSDKMKEVVKGLNVTVEELVKKIESIQQALH